MDAEVYASSERESLCMAASVSVCMCVSLLFFYDRTIDGFRWKEV